LEQSAAINADVQKVFASSEFRENVLKPRMLGTIAGSPDQFAEFVKAEAYRWKIGRAKYRHSNQLGQWEPWHPAPSSSTLDAGGRLPSWQLLKRALGETDT